MLETPKCFTLVGEIHHAMNYDTDTGSKHRQPKTNTNKHAHQQHQQHDETNHTTTPTLFTNTMNPNPSPANLEAFDAPLIALTNQCGGDLRHVLRAFFSFLHRRTDFYLVPSEEDLKAARAKMGFREGDAEKVLLASFRQFPLRRLAASSKSTSSNSTTSSMPNTDSNTPAKKENRSTEKDSTEKDSTEKDPNSTEKGITEKDSMEKDSKEKDATQPLRLTEDGLQVPVGNGGSTERYTWTQTIDECSVLVSVPETTRGKDLDVSIKSCSLSVKLKNRPDDPILMVGSLEEKVVPDESTWTLEGGVLIVVLYKQKKTFWSTILDGDEKIDTALVDSRRHINEYDDATQAQIRKIIFDQNQARKGLSSSAEISGETPTVPDTLPPGVEYINQEKLDEFHANK